MLPAGYSRLLCAHGSRPLVRLRKSLSSWNTALAGERQRLRSAAGQLLPKAALSILLGHRNLQGAVTYSFLKGT